MFSLENVDDACCSLLKGVEAGTMPTPQQLCSSCKGQGKGQVQTLVNEACNSTNTLKEAPVMHAELLGVKAPFTMQASGTCTAGADDCKATISQQGMDVTVVLKDVGSGCCSALNKLVADATSGTEPSKADGQAACTQCKSSGNLLVEQVLQKAQAEGLCDKGSDGLVTPAAVPKKEKVQEKLSTRRNVVKICSKAYGRPFSTGCRNG